MEKGIRNMTKRWIVEGRCMECGLEVIPGEHSGHRAHFTGAWHCHDCGALCDGGDDE